MSEVVHIFKFYIRVIKRVLLLFLKKEKAIKLINFTYKPDIDTNDTLIIRYAFTNALWYRFDGKKTLEGRQVVVRNSNTSKEISLSVQGFMKKSHYIIKLLPDAVFIVEKPKTIHSPVIIDRIL